MDNSPVVQTTNNPIEPVPLQSSKNYLKFIIGGIVIFVAFISGGLFLEKYLYIPKPPVIVQPAVTATQVIIPSLIPSIDPTANWKTYNNNISKYSINIPPNWIVNDKKGSFLGIPGEIVIGSQSEMNKGIWGTTIAITEMSSSDRYGLDTQQQFDEWLTKKISLESNESMYKIGNVKIDGMNAIQIVERSTKRDMHPFYLIVTWVRKSGTNYYIELMGNDSDKVTKFTNNYDQILSTFKFLE